MNGEIPPMFGWNSLVYNVTTIMRASLIFWKNLKRLANGLPILQLPPCSQRNGKSHITGRNWFTSFFNLV